MYSPVSLSWRPSFGSECRIVSSGNVKFFESVKRMTVTDLQDLEEPLDEGEDSFITLQDDPWGHPYWLESSGRKRHVCSAGPDGQEDSEDDICYPSKEEG